MATRSEERGEQETQEILDISVSRAAFTRAAMVNVTARKIRGSAHDHLGISVGKAYTGFLISYPVLGRGMVIFRDPHGHRMITSPVRRVLAEVDAHSFFVETENSVYRLTIHRITSSTPVPASSPKCG